MTLQFPDEQFGSATKFERHVKIGHVTRFFESLFSLSGHVRLLLLYFVWLTVDELEAAEAEGRLGEGGSCPWSPRSSVSNEPGIATSNPVSESL